MVSKSKMGEVRGEKIDILVIVISKCNVCNSRREGGEGLVEIRWENKVCDRRERWNTFEYFRASR
jgi:hypothetical protein